MSTGKYVPPHKRRSSANKPTPYFANDSLPNESIEHNQQNIKRDSFGRIISIQNTPNSRTLPETKMKYNEIDIINLDEYVVNKKLEQQITFEILSKYLENDIINIIMTFCNDNDIVLIPNIFHRDEFLKYWFIVSKGEEMNEYRDGHRVDLYSNYLQLIRRGSIASIKGYKPSKTAKLKLECKFIYHNVTDHITFSLQSKGIRDTTTDRSWCGEVYAQNQVFIFNQIGWQRSNKIWIKTRDGLFVMEKAQNIPPPPLHKELCVTIIDDGEKLRVEYCCNNGNVYFLNSDSGSHLQGYHRVAVYNRFFEGNICDLTYLKLSIVTENK